MEKIKKFLKQCDYVSFKPTLYENGEIRHKTILGGISELLLLTLNFFGLIFFSQDIYYRQNPSVLEHFSNENNPPEWVLKHEDFSFVFALTDPATYAAYVDESIYNLEIYQNQILNGSLAVHKQLKIERCSIENFPGVSTEIFSQGFAFHDYYCINKDEQPYIRGSVSSANLSYIQLFAKPCNNKTGQCQSEQVIQSKLNGCTAYIFYIDKHFVSSNYTSPTQYFFNQMNTGVSNKIYNAVLFMFEQVKFLDDTGFIFEDQDTRTYLAVDSIEKRLDFRPSEVFLEIVFIFSQNIKHISRKYKRIQQVAAEVGGLISLLSLFIKGFMEYFSERHYINQLSEQYNSITVIPKYSLARREVILSTHDHFLKEPRVEKVKIKELLEWKKIIENRKQLELIKLLFLSKINLELFDKFLTSKNSNMILANCVSDWEFETDLKNLSYQTVFHEKMKEIINLCSNSISLNLTSKKIDLSYS